MRRIALVLFFVTALSALGQSSHLIPAFPGAEGHGRYTQGGRGGKIVHVTNLNDAGEGSLREAVKGSASKIIVFDVAGVIPLESALNIGENTTIAGQTAPYPGITLRYNTVRPNNNNIIRFLRMRLGDEKETHDDAIWQRRKTAIIIDHCSMSWGTDETVTFYDNNNFTLQWCSIGESLCYANTNPEHVCGYGGLWGGKLASFHHNLITNMRNRVPRFNGARYQWEGYTDNLLYDAYHWKNSVQAEIVDFRNCIIYNWGDANGCYGGTGGGYINIVNNYYKAGPATLNRDKVTEVNVGTDENTLKDLSSRYYIHGNYVTEAGNEAANYDWRGVIYDLQTCEIDGELYTIDPYNWYGDEVPHIMNADGIPCVRIKMDESTPKGEVTTHSAEMAYEKVLKHVGASVYRDEVDHRYMTEVRDGITTYMGARTEMPGIVEHVSDVNGYTEDNFPTGHRPDDFDTDQDGIPDEWEKANGLNPNNPDDAQLYTIDSKGWYPNVEVYLNSLVQDIMQSGNADAECNIDEYFPPYVHVETLTKTVYAVNPDQVFTSGQTIMLENINLTYGEAGGPDFLPATSWPLNDVFPAYTPGNNVNGNNQGGTFYVFESAKNGILTVAVKQNRSKPLYVEEDGMVLHSFNGITLDDSQPDAYTFSFPVKANSTYKLYCSGSKLGFYGFIFKWVNGETGIRDILERGKTTNYKYYNLAGQRLSKPQKGINFVNGKKVVIK